MLGKCYISDSLVQISLHDLVLMEVPGTQFAISFSDLNLNFKILPCIQLVAE